ncbi:MAG: hypothetical protein U0271_30450 [Polyangiaceae bacterium]
MSDLAHHRGVKLSCAVDVFADVPLSDMRSVHGQLVSLLEVAIGLEDWGGHAGLEVMVDDDGMVRMSAWNGRPSSMPAVHAA